MKSFKIILGLLALSLTLQAKAPLMEFFLSYYEGGNCLVRAQSALKSAGFTLGKSTFASEDVTGTKGEFKGAVGCSSEVPNSVVFIVAGNSYQEAKKLAMQIQDSFMKNRGSSKANK